MIIRHGRTLDSRQKIREHLKPSFPSLSLPMAQEHERSPKMQKESVIAITSVNRCMPEQRLLFVNKMFNE